MNDLFSVPIKVHPYMTGCDRAIMLDGVMSMSQELWDKFKNADEAELERLGNEVKVLNLGKSSISSMYSREGIKFELPVDLRKLA